MDFSSDAPGLIVTAIDPMETGDGKKFDAYTYFPSQGGNWECVSYGEEDDFYLTFVLSARSQANYEKAFPSFKAMMNAYK